MNQEWLDPRIFFLILHILGTAMGAGAAFVGDAIFLHTAKNKIITSDSIRIMKVVSNLVWIGSFILLLSGVGLVLFRPEIFLYSEKLWAKLTIVTVIIINGLIFHRIHFPVFQQSVNKKFTSDMRIIIRRVGIVMSGVVSVVSWNYVIVLGVLGRVPFTYFQIIGIYLLILIIAMSIGMLLKNRLLSS